MGIAGITFGGYLVAVNPSEWFSWTSGLPVGVAGAVRASGGVVTTIGLIVITLALNEKYKHGWPSLPGALVMRLFW